MSYIDDEPIVITGEAYRRAAIRACKKLSKERAKNRYIINAIKKCMHDHCKNGDMAHLSELVDNMQKNL